MVATARRGAGGNQGGLGAAMPGYPAGDCAALGIKGRLRSNVEGKRIHSIWMTTLKGK